MSHVFHFPGAAACEVGDVVVLDGDDGHHAVRVRRIHIGEPVELVDGAGTRATCTVVSVAKAACAVEVLATKHEPASLPRITVLQALVKKDRSDQVVELLTEAGVDRIVPWAAQRSQMREVPPKWPRILVESSKQSRRSRFPELAPLADTAAAVALAAEVSVDGCVLVCHEASEGAHIRDVLTRCAPIGHVLIVIGPEGGLTEVETEQFLAVGGNIAWLGPTVMRAATAGAVAAAIVSALTERWQGGVSR